jgi:hypothetical protein
VSTAPRPQARTRSEAAQALARRRQTLGLVLIAALILAAALLRAPAHLLFPPGWWRF